MSVLRLPHEAPHTFPSTCRALWDVLQTQAGCCSLCGLWETGWGPGRVEGHQPQQLAPSITAASTPEPWFRVRECSDLGARELSSRIWDSFGCSKRDVCAPSGRAASPRSERRAGLPPDPPSGPRAVWVLSSAPAFPGEGFRGAQGLLPARLTSLWAGGDLSALHPSPNQGSPRLSTNASQVPLQPCFL